jgi:hypothetical protein
VSLNSVQYFFCSNEIEFVGIFLKMIVRGYAFFEVKNSLSFLNDLTSETRIIRQTEAVHSSLTFPAELCCLSGSLTNNLLDANSVAICGFSVCCTNVDDICLYLPPASAGI